MGKKCSTRRTVFSCVMALVFLLGSCVWSLVRCANANRVASDIGFSDLSDTECSNEIVMPQSTMESVLTEEEQNESVLSGASEAVITNSIEGSGSQEGTGSLSSQSDQQISSSPTLDSINEGEIVYADLKAIQPPSESDFGGYYSYAVDIYQQHLTGTYEEKTYEFDSDEDADAFLNQFNNICLKDTGIVLHLKSQTSNYGKTQIKLFQLSVQDYQDLLWKQNMILSIVGNGISERTVVERLTNWCIANCSYDYTYQAHYVDGLLRDKTGICFDFTSLVCDVCELYGIPCEYISSPDDGRDYLDRHAWNRICIGGTWYYTDITWSVCCGYNAYPLSEILWEDHYEYL